MLDPSDYANSLAETVSDLVAQIEVRLIWEIARDVNRGLGGGSRYEVDMAARYGALYARLQKQLGKPWKNVLATVQAAWIRQLRQAKAWLSATSRAAWLTTRRRSACPSPTCGL